MPILNGEIAVGAGESINTALLALQQHPEVVSPVDVALSSFMRTAGFDYSRLSILAQREYRLPNDSRHPRVRLLVAKGEPSLKRLFENRTRYKKYIDLNCDGYKAVYDFYNALFGDDPAITPCLNDPEAWHLILMANRRPTTKEEKDEGDEFNPWCVLSACSFTDYSDIQVLYVRWLGTNMLERAIFERWNTPKTNVSVDKQMYFNGSHLAMGRGIGTTMVAAAQWICSVIAEAEEDPFSIIVQSSMQSLSFYTFGLGMTQVTNSDRIPAAIESKLIQSPELILLRLDSKIVEVRPPDIGERRFNQQDIWTEALKNYLKTMTAGSENDQIDSQRFEFPHPKHNQSAFYYSMKRFTSKESKDLKSKFHVVKELSSKTSYGVGARLITKDQEDLFQHYFRDIDADSCLIVVPQPIVGLFLTRLLMHNYFLNQSPSIQNAFLSSRSGDLAQNYINEYFEECKNSCFFDAERQLLISILWHYAKRETGFDKSLLKDEQLYQMQVYDQKKHLISFLDTAYQKSKRHTHTEFEKATMRCASMLFAIHKGTFKKSDEALSSCIPPPDVQACFRSLAYYLGDDKNFTNNERVYYVLSMLFKVSFTQHYFNKSKSKKVPHTYDCTRQQFNYHKSPSTYGAEIALFVSKETNAKQSELEHAVLVKRESVDVLRKMLEEYKVAHQKRMKEREAEANSSRPSRKSLRPEFSIDLEDDAKQPAQPRPEEEEDEDDQSDAKQPAQRRPEEEEDDNDQSNANNERAAAGSANVDDDDQPVVAIGTAAGSADVDHVLKDLLFDDDDDLVSKQDNDEVEDEEEGEADSRSMQLDHEELPLLKPNFAPDFYPTVRHQAVYEKLRDTLPGDSKRVIQLKYKHNYRVIQKNFQVSDRNEIDKLIEQSFRIYFWRNQDQQNSDSDEGESSSGKQSFAKRRITIGADKIEDSRKKRKLSCKESLGGKSRQSSAADEQNEDSVESSMEASDDDETQQESNDGDDKSREEDNNEEDVNSGEKNDEQKSDEDGDQKSGHGKGNVSFRKKNLFVTYRQDGPFPLHMPNDNKPSMKKHTYQWNPKTLDGKIRSKKVMANDLKLLKNDFLKEDNVVHEMIDFPEGFTVEQVPTDVSDQLRKEYKKSKFVEHRDCNFARIHKDVHDFYKKDIIAAKDHIVALEKEFAKIKRSRQSAEKKEDARKALEAAKLDLTILRQSIKNEEFLAHPDSIVALREVHPAVDGIYMYEAITADVMLDERGGRDKGTRIYLTKRWVQNNFTPLFLKTLKEKEKNQDFLHLPDVMMNPTEDARLISRGDHRDAFMALPEEGGENGAKIRYMRKKHSSVMNVTSLKLVGTFTDANNSTLQDINMQWFITSQPVLEKKLRSSKDANVWKPILHGLVMHEGCIGGDTAKRLIKELNARFKQHTRSGNGVPAEFESSVIEFPFNHPNGKTISPQYILGEQQVAAIKWDGGKYIGKVLESVPKDGRKIYTFETLAEQWVHENCSPAFCKLLRDREKSFLWIPVGDSRPNSYPFEYDKSFPKIEYKQEDRDTCITSSLASCFHHLYYQDVLQRIRHSHFSILQELALDIEVYGVKTLATEDDASANVMKNVIQHLRENSAIQRCFKIVKVHNSNFDIWDQSTAMNPKLLQLIGGDGGVAHAITIYNNMIFDSNLDYAVPLNHVNLEYCVDATYTGVMWGYEFIPNLSPLSSSKRRQKKFNAKKRFRKGQN